MGCNTDEVSLCAASEESQHEVTTPAYCIDEMEVTAGAFAECPTDTCSFNYGPNCTLESEGKDLHPINCIGWESAYSYCEWRYARLCTEAEWEKAARGGCEKYPGQDCKIAMPIYPWGDKDANCNLAVMSDCDGATQPVGSRRDGDSCYGVSDLSGNVWEWVEDDWHGNYAGAPDDGSAWIDETRDSERVLRGGSFEHPAGSMCTCFRVAYPSFLGGDGIGFRCCMSLN
jgi:formylglycine-generating enzyme required for sulfatase activity